MPAQSKAARIATIGAAASHDLNDELTIMLTAAAAAIERTHLGHPARQHLTELRAAAYRAALKTCGLLNYCQRNGARFAPATMEALIDHQK